MFESNPKKTIKDVTSLPTIGDTKTIYRLTTFGSYYVWSELIYDYKELAASSFLVGGSSLNASDSITTDIYRSGRIGISDVANYTPKYAIEIYKTNIPSFFNSASEDSESGYLITTKWDDTQLGNTTNKGWKIYGKPNTASEKPNALFITHWNGVTWLPSMQFHATTGSVTVGNVPTPYTPANYFEVWGNAKFAAKIEDSAGSYGTAGQVLSSNGTAGGVRWNTSQSLLVSGTNIKTVNGASILGSGNINVGRSRVTQAPTTLANQHIAAAGAGMTILFSANVISTQGQIIDLDFLARNNSEVGSIMRVYVNNSATLSGALQIANFSLGALTDQMMRMTRRLVVIRDSLTTNNWFLIGADGLGYNTDIVYTAGQLYNNYSLGSSTLLEKTFIIVALNQQASLIAASIEY